MDFVKGNNREQITFSTLELKIEEENIVRFVDAFVDQLKLTKLGFVIQTLKSEG